MVTVTDIEQAICDRLRDGLGNMVSDVVSWDVMTDDIGIILRCLPGAFVTFAGITSSQAHDTRRTRYKVSGRFAVYVADYNLRDNESARHGGVNLDEPGCYRLVRAVRRLLAGQDMGLDITSLRPATVKMVTNKVFAGQAIAIYECLFDTAWYEDALGNRHWPQAPDDESDPDYDFVRWNGRLEDSTPYHNSTHADYLIHGQVVAQDTVSKTTMEKEDD